MLAHLRVARYRAQHAVVQRRGAARGIGLHLPSETRDDAHGDAVGALVVVAVLGTPVTAQCQHTLVSHIVGTEGRQ